MNNNGWDAKKIEDGVRLMLEGLGCDINDRNFVGTPKRVADAFAELFVPPDEDWPLFKEDYCGIVLAKNHICYTLCPHHLLPVTLTISMAYQPHGQCIGLSKLPRMVADVNRKPLLQEQLTATLADRLYNIPGSGGSAVFVKGRHSCVSIRGIKSPAEVITTAVRGSFEQPEAWDNFCRIAVGQ
jgi:GTP cyclohydrolase I